MLGLILRIARTRDFREGCRAAYFGLSLPALVILAIIDPATGWRTPHWLTSVLSLAGMSAALAVENLRQRRVRPVGAGAPGGVVAEQPGDVPDEVVGLVRQGRKVRAVKRYRELRKDLSLKEAKKIIDRI